MVLKTNYRFMKVKSIILSTFIKLPFVIKIFVLSILSGRFTQVLLYFGALYANACHVVFFFFCCAHLYFLCLFQGTFWRFNRLETQRPCEILTMETFLIYTKDFLVRRVLIYASHARWYLNSYPATIFLS